MSLTPEDAYRELQAYEARLRPNDAGSASAAAASEILRNDFPRYALERSDCSSFRQNGDLGEFGRGQMQRPFEEASFALQPGEMSTIVDTDSGYHLIYRIS